MEEKYEKDFDGWIEKKKALDGFRQWPSHVFQRQIWWCALGVNIGSEIDGKNEDYERPVLIVRHLTRETILVAPLTGTLSDKPHSPRIRTDKVDSTVKFNQLRTVSKRRLLRLIDIVDIDQFIRLQALLADFISQKDGNPDQ
jgi:mRNA-degrading endonuclease toxin of MazEF toxin-antitoxin module